VFPAPGPASVNTPVPAGSATLLGSYGGIDPNGTWSLYAIDDSLGGVPATVSGGWSLDITTAGGSAATTTTVSSSLNPALTTDSITFTSTTTSGGPPVAAGTVSFTQNSIAIAGCTNVPVNATGNAGCTTTLSEGARTILATYNGSAGLAVSSGSLSQVINSPTVAVGNQYCNAGGISLPDNGSGFPYSSNILVTDRGGSKVQKLTVQLNNLTIPRGQEMDFMLVGPGGQAFLIASDAGNSTAISGVTISLDDDAALALPSTTLTSGTFRPTDVSAGPADTFPAPAPASFNRPAPAGTSTFASVFAGVTLNGNWALYAVDDGLGGGTGTIGGWCVNFVETTAAGASVSGKVIGLNGRGVANASVSLTNADGQTISVKTNTFGNYRFSDVRSGVGYAVSVIAKGRRFPSTFIDVSDNISNLDLREESP
jgi:hypothetical protein